MPQPTHTAADVTAQLLIDLGLASDVEQGTSWPVFVNGRPDQPDSLVSVTDTQGLDGGRLMVSKQRLEYHGLQLLLRSAKQHDAHAKTRQVCNALDEVLQATVRIAGGNGIPAGRYLVHSIQRTGTPLSMGREPTSARRTMFSINCLVTLTQLE